MYDQPQTAAANDRFWNLIRDRLRLGGIDAPDALERKTPSAELWSSNDLLLSQTCARPYRLTLYKKSTLIGTPDYGHERCAPGWYRSAFVVRTTDPRFEVSAFENAIFAYNTKTSHSGWGAPLCHAKSLGFGFHKFLETGDHNASAQAVAEGRADIAALDALSWTFVKRYEECSLDLRVVDWCSPAPGLPFITSKARHRKTIFEAITNAISALAITDRITLRLQGLVDIPPETYLAVPAP